MYLLRLETQEHVVLLTLHHIITDGWSNEILVRELTTLYRAYVSGQSCPSSSLTDPVCRLCPLATSVVAG